MSSCTPGGSLGTAELSFELIEAKLAPPAQRAETVVKSELKDRRNEHEDALLERFREVLPAGVKVTILADRGFGDQALYELLKEQLGLD